MASETYLIAKAALRKIQAKPSSDTQILNFLSPSPLVACSNAAQNIQHLNISNEEKEIFECSSTIDGVQEFILQYVAEVEKKAHHQKAWKKVYTFSKFAGPVLDVFQAANLSPECSVALGLIGMLLIQPLNNKSEIEDRLEQEIEQLHEVISQVNFSKNNIRTVEMEAEVQGLCAAIIDFLTHALKYQKKWGIVKVLNSFFADFARRFQAFLNKIQGHASKIEVLAQRGYTTTLLDTKETLDRTAQTIQDLQSHAVAQAMIFDLRIARLEDSISRCKLAIDNSSRFSAILHVQKLSALLIPNPPSFERESIQIRQQENLLAPRECWEANVSEIQAPGWLSLSPRPLLWIGGRRNKRNVSFVSSFSLDLVDAMQMERGVGVIPTLCTGRQSENLANPLSIFKEGIFGLLNSNPEIVLVPENLQQLSAQRFEKIESAEDAYKVLVDVLRMVDRQCQQDGKELFWIIDRVDVLLTSQKPQDRQRFVKGLQQLCAAYKSLRIILTSQFLMEEMEIVATAREAMEIWVDTSKPLAMHSRY